MINQFIDQPNEDTNVEDSSTHADGGSRADNEGQSDAKKIKRIKEKLTYKF